MKFCNIQQSTNNIETIIEIVSKILSQRIPSLVVKKYASKLFHINKTWEFYASKVEIPNLNFKRWYKNYVKTFKEKLLDYVMSKVTSCIKLHSEFRIHKNQKQTCSQLLILLQLVDEQHKQCCNQRLVFNYIPITKTSFTYTKYCRHENKIYQILFCGNRQRNCVRAKCHSEG